MPLTAVRGKGGSGKNTIVAWLCQKYFSDVQKYTNFPLRLPKTKQIDSMELFELDESDEPIIALWDESYTEAENRDSMTDENKIKSYIPMQARKNNLSLIIIEQINIMDIRFRQLEESLIYCFDRPIYNPDFTLYEGDFHYAYVKNGKIVKFILPYNEAKKVFDLFNTNRKIFPKDFDEMKKKIKLGNDSKARMDYIRNIAKEIKQKCDLVKITHDTVSYSMLDLGYINDLQYEKYVYIILKGEMFKNDKS